MIELKFVVHIKYKKLNLFTY